MKIIVTVLLVALALYLIEHIDQNMIFGQAILYTDNA